jgi:hypothetical protein
MNLSLYAYYFHLLTKQTSKKKDNQTRDQVIPMSALINKRVEAVMYSVAATNRTRRQNPMHECEIHMLWVNAID